MTLEYHHIINDLQHWTRYAPRLCKSCVASCCTLPVEVNAADLCRLQLADPYLLEENPKKAARQLKKEGIIEHYHHKTGLFTFTRRSDGSCTFLDSKTRRCTVYAQRPDTCRNHPHIGPKPGYCAYINAHEHS